jgi:hypothetical protein
VSIDPNLALPLTHHAFDMEAVAAFGLAANILQVVDFAQKLLSTSRQIYQAGSTVQSNELEIVAKDFAILNKRLTSRARLGPSVQGPLTEDVQVRVHC